LQFSLPVTLRGPAGGLSFTEDFDFSLALNPEYDILVYH
jgi:hypothetical protein